MKNFITVVAMLSLMVGLSAFKAHQYNVYLSSINLNDYVRNPVFLAGGR